jgi:hypothetical protein
MRPSSRRIKDVVVENFGLLDKFHAVVGTLLRLYDGYVDLDLLVLAPRGGGRTTTTRCWYLLELDLIPTPTLLLVHTRGDEAGEAEGEADMTPCSKESVRSWALDLLTLLD